jgi:flagellar motor switch protein FliM
LKEILSQEEIDALLNALQTGEIDASSVGEDEDRNKVKAYDFRRPIKLSKEYINTLYMVFENFAKLSSSQLSSLVNATVLMTVEMIEQISYEEFINSIPNPTLLGVYRSRPLNGTQVLEINPQFATQVIERVCGGASTKGKSISKKDKFTDIELGILEDLVLSLLRPFQTAWDDIVEIETELDSLETNPQMVQSITPNEPVVLVSFSVELFAVKSLINLCIPYTSFEQITDKLSIRSWFEVDKAIDNTHFRAQISDRLMSAGVDLTVELGRTWITVNDFIHLEMGDVVRLDAKTDEPLRLFVEDRLHYFVQPGDLEGKLGVQILDYVEEDVKW